LKDTKNLKKILNHENAYPLWLGGDGGGELTPLNDGDTM